MSGWLAGLGSGGWRWAFGLFGAVGFLWAFALAFLLRDTPQPVAAAGAAADKPSVREAVGAFFGRPTAILLTVGLGFYIYATYGFKTWCPAFLLRTFPGMMPSGAAFHAVFWFYCGAMAGVYDSNLYASLLDAVSPRYRAAAVGIFGCGGNVLGALGPGLIGWLNGRLGMRASLASLAAFTLVGAAVILVARFAWRRGRRAKADA